MAVLDRSAIEARNKLDNGLDFVGLHGAAEKARALAYAPYSGFTVGAALLTDSGQVVTGGNVENGSYGVTICAERAAVVRALAEGHRKFQAIAIAGDTDRVETLASCGACLQVLAEFDPSGDLEVVFPDQGRLRVAPLRELLPVQFRLTD
jgi:cytidine deaminase